MSKHYTPSMKVKSGIGADGKFYIDVTSDAIGTVIIDGEAERIAWLLDLVRYAALEEAAKFVEENYEEEMINIVGNQSWRERGPKNLAAAIRAMQSIPQNSNPAQSDGSSGSHNAHAPDAPDS